MVIAPELAERLVRGAALSELQAAHLAKRCAELQSEAGASRENDEAYHTPTSVAENATPDCPSGTVIGEKPPVDDPSPEHKRSRKMPPLIPDSCLPPLPDELDFGGDDDEEDDVRRVIRRLRERADQFGQRAAGLSEPDVVSDDRVRSQAILVLGGTTSIRFGLAVC